MAKHILRGGPTAFKDLLGQRFGRLTVVRDAGPGRDGHTLWECRCDCGKFKTVVGKRLRNGTTTSCRCLANERTRRRKLLDLTGKKFGRLTAVSPHGKRRRTTTWLCRCECGKDHVASVANLNSGHSQSCGCLKRDVTSRRMRTHGATAGEKVEAEFRIWCGIRGRCKSESNRSYPYYGGRGITIDPRWDDYARFRADMGPRPSPLHEIDRIDGDGPYSPENCRWTTRKQNARNRRSCRAIEANGERKTLSEWAESSGLSGGTIAKRIEAGWTPDRAVSEPLRHCGKATDDTARDMLRGLTIRLRSIRHMLAASIGADEAARIFSEAVAASAGEPV